MLCKDYMVGNGGKIEGQMKPPWGKQQQSPVKFEIILLVSTFHLRIFSSEIKGRKDEFKFGGFFHESVSSRCCLKLVICKLLLCVRIFICCLFFSWSSWQRNKVSDRKLFRNFRTTCVIKWPYDTGNWFYEEPKQQSSLLQIFPVLDYQTWQKVKTKMQ